MSREPQALSDKTFCFLRGCLVEGDAEQRARERRIRRRALAISIGLQSAALAALLIIPLIGRSERISMGIVTPIPPYSPHRSPVQAAQPGGGPPRACQFCAPTRISPVITMHDAKPTGDGSDPIIDVGPPGAVDDPNSIHIPDSRPARPPDEGRRETQTKRIHVGVLEPAMLIRRIEPVYPILAKQTGRAGRVELHAIIATDGTIQSLQVVDGDALFVRSALDAVSQWRYRPTLLNGQPVEIDTHITVIYSLQR
jgi:protein TonB